MVFIINCALGAWVIFKVYTSGLETLFSDSLIYFIAFAFLLILFVPAYKNVQHVRYLRMTGDVIEVNRIHLLGYGALPYFPSKETEIETQNISDIKSGKWIKDFVTITFLKAGKETKIKTFLKNQELKRLTSGSPKESFGQAGY
jgi:hypothetical protein